MTTTNVPRTITSFLAAALAGAAGCGVEGDVFSCPDGLCEGLTLNATAAEVENRANHEDLRGTTQFVPADPGDPSTWPAGEEVVIEPVEGERLPDGAAAVPGPCFWTTRVANVRDGGQSYEYPVGPNWSVEGNGPGTLQLNHSVTVSHGVSWTGQISKGLVSTAVGYNVSWSGTTSTAWTYNVPAGQRWVVYAGMYKIATLFEVQQRNACDRVWRTVGRGMAKRYIRLVYGQYRIR
jgi:hypothetical protein